MKVLGIDPGTAACGYGIVHASGGRLKAVEFGWWQTPACERPELRLKQIHDAIAELIERHEPEAVVLEESFVGADARTALSVGQARGAVLVASALAGVECAEYAPSRVKQTSDVVNVGDQVKVKVLGIDDRGKVKLSMKVVDQKTGEDLSKRVAESQPEAGTGAGA